MPFEDIDTVYDLLVESTQVGRQPPPSTDKRSGTPIGNAITLPVFIETAQLDE